MVGNQVSDTEFQLIVTKFSQYNVLKEAVWAKLTRQPSRPDVEKTKQDIRCEVEEEFRKNRTALSAGSN